MTAVSPSGANPEPELRAYLGARVQEGTRGSQSTGQPNHPQGCFILTETYVILLACRAAHYQRAHFISVEIMTRMGHEEPS